jgi:putative ABC transport system permease protein
MWSLARKLLFHDRLRFAVAIAGVSVSVMLVLVQVGLYYGFMNTASSIIDASRADLWVGRAGNESFEFAAPFDERTVYKVASVPGVERTERVLMNFAQFKLADGGDLGVQIVGLDMTPGHRPMLAPWNVIAGDANRLREAGAIVLDRSEYSKLKIDRVGHTTEISGVHARVVALTDGIRSFTTSPIVFTDMRSARSFMPVLGDAAVTYVLVKVAPGESVAAVQQRINALPHLAAYTTSEISKRTRSYWSSRTGVGAGFFTTAVLGVIVGFVVVGQILYSGTLQYIREYGTLKAMGARNSMVVRVILSQAMISAAIGFVFGSVLAIGMQAAMAKANLTVALFPGLYAATLVVTIAMCSFAALLSIVKVLRLDPASVFKG